MKTVKEVEENINLFWKYVDRCRVMELISDAFTDLYNEPERPQNPMEFIKNKIVGPKPPIGTLERLRNHLNEANGYIDALEEQLELLKVDKAHKQMRKRAFKVVKKMEAQREAMECAKKFSAELLSYDTNCEEYYSNFEEGEGEEEEGDEMEEEYDFSTSSESTLEFTEIIMP